MSISDTPVVVFVAGVQFVENVSESVPLAVYLKIVHFPVPPPAVPSPQLALFEIVGSWVTRNVLLPVTVGRGIAGADAYPVSPGAQKSPVCVTVLVVGNVTTRPGA